MDSKKSSTSLNKAIDKGTVVVNSLCECQNTIEEMREFLGDETCDKLQSDIANLSFELGSAIFKCYLE